MENFLSFNVNLDDENAIEQLDNISKKISDEKVMLLTKKRNEEIGDIIGKCLYYYTRTSISYVYVFSENLYVYVHDGLKNGNSISFVNETLDTNSLFYKEFKVCKDDSGFWETFKKCKSSIERIEKLKEYIKYIRSDLQRNMF